MQFEFEAEAGDIIVITILSFGEDGHVNALIVPETDRARLESGLFSARNAVMATRSDPVARYTVTTSGRWIVDVPVLMGTVEAVLQRSDGQMVAPIKVVGY
jgi:6-phosphogluconolactonase/glucosamine-6-phosphate isomerase/deaminase